jgi:hypothetical protein
VEAPAFDLLKPRAVDVNTSGSWGDSNWRLMKYCILLFVGMAWKFSLRLKSIHHLNNLQQKKSIHLLICLNFRVVGSVV